MTNSHPNLFLQLTLFILFLNVTSLNGQIVTDTISDYPWELMETPAHNVTSFAKSGNRMFAGAGTGLFFSDDEGLSWERHEAFGTEGIHDVIATDSAVMVTQTETISVNPPYSSSSIVKVFVSNDNGENFELRQNIAYGSFHFGSTWVNPIFGKDENTFCIMRNTGGAFSYSELYLSEDSGVTWDTINYQVHGNLLEKDDELYLHRYRDDTLLIHQLAANSYDIISVDTVPTPNFPYVARVNSHYHDNLIRLSYNEFFATTDDFGQTWQIDTLPNELEPRFIDCVDNEIFVGSQIGIYQVLPSINFQIDTVYDSYLSHHYNNGTTAFFKHEEEFWVSDYGGIYFAENDDFVWNKRDYGVTNAHGGGINLEDKLILNSPNGHYEIDAGASEWQLLVDSLSLHGFHPDIKVGDTFFKIGYYKLYRSDDGQNWEELSFPIGYYSRFHKEDNRLFVYFNEKMLVTVDEGESWDTLITPGINSLGHLFTNEDSLLVLSTDNGDLLRYASSNGGIDWDTTIVEGNFPLRFGQQFYQVGHKYYSFHHFDGLVISEDWGLSWTTLSDSDYFFYFSTVGANVINNRIVAVSDDLILAHIQYRLWASQDAGLTWIILDDLPFHSTYSYYSGGIPQPYNISVGTQYEFFDDNLYVFTNGQGVWRTPVTNLLAAMSGNFAHTDLELSITAPSEYKIYEPIPYQITVENTGTLHATDIKINSPLPAGLVYTSDDVTTGDFNLYYEDWTIPELAAGESATLDLVLFPLVNNAPLSLFAQITAASPEDWDSTPDNNFDQNEVNEDDEAIAISYPMMPLVNALNWNPLDIELFPNPASEVLNVYWNMENESVENLQIIGIRGKVVQTILLENNDFGNTTLDISNLETGVYFVQFQMKEGVLIKRFFKK